MNLSKTSYNLIHERNSEQCMEAKKWENKQGDVVKRVVAFSWQK